MLHSHICHAVLKDFPLLANSLMSYNTKQEERSFMLWRITYPTQPGDILDTPKNKKEVKEKKICEMMLRDVR